MSAPTLFGDLPETSSAVISDDGVYRYLLTRSRAAGPDLTFIMLNPSTADDRVDDPTIRRVLGFAWREGAGRLVVVNLYGLRATDPKELARHPEPVGPRNDEFIRLHCQPRALVVAAWGNSGGLRAAYVTDMLTARGVRLMCLGRTRSGEPRHPLYVRGDKPLEPYAAVIPS